VWVDEVPGGGAAFRIALPVDGPPVAAPRGDQELQVLDLGAPEMPDTVVVDVEAESEAAPPRDSIVAALELSALASDEEPALTGWTASAPPMPRA
jgi:hypothetical protein